VELGPGEPVPLWELARDLAAAGLPREAVPHTLQLLRIAPYSPAVHETTALVAMKLGICVDALRSQQRAIDTLSDRASPKARAEKEKVLADYQRRCSAPSPAAPPGP
jgi:hypothetical protein